ncbi:MAG TPA: 3-hydroxyacyl-ACP dehydratase FabZ family protein [Gemmata sp.]
MSAEVPAIDPSAFDFSRLIAGIDEIRAINPHRHEFELLTGIVHIDTAAHVVVGFKDATENDFWTRGHMPGFPLLPGVLMCEAAAQLCSYYYTTQIIGKPGVLLGLAGIDEAKFVRTVRPGERLILVGVGVKVHRRLTRFHVRGFVGAERTFEALITGVPLGRLEDLRGA